MSQQLRSYFYFFIRQGKLPEFFGRDVLALSVVILLVCLLVVFRYQSIANFNALTLLFLGAIIMFTPALTLPWVLSSQVTASHKNYLAFLGFTRQQIHALARLIALPVLLATALCFFMLATTKLVWWQALGLTVAALIITEALSAVLLWLQEWWGRKTQVKGSRTRRVTAASPANTTPHTFTSPCAATAPHTCATPHTSATSRAFINPYRAFLQKDIRELQSFDVYASSALLSLLGIGTILLAGAVPHWQVFLVSLYLVVVFLAVSLVFWLYGCEQKAYCYYRSLLRLKNSQIVRYKLPIQLVIILGVLCACTLLHALIAGFAIEFLLCATAVAAYAVLLCITCGWWFIRRLEKGGEFHMLYLLCSLVVAIPGFAVIYLLAVVLPRRRLAGTSVERTHLA